MSVAAYAGIAIMWSRLTDDLQAIMQEIVRCDALERIHIGLDFFDASINRIGAWAIGTRNACRALLMALAGTARAAASNMRMRATSPVGWRCWKS